MPVLALLFLRYAYSRYKMVEAELLQNRPSRGGRVMPVEPSDFAAKSLGSTGIMRPPRLGRFFSNSASTILKRLYAYLRNNNANTGIQYWLDVSLLPARSKSADSQRSASSLRMFILSVMMSYLKVGRCLQGRSSLPEGFLKSF